MAIIIDADEPFHLSIVIPTIAKAFNLRLDFQ